MAKIHEDLERKIKDRTAELEEANERLRLKVEENKQAEGRILRLNRLFSFLNRINEAVFRLRNAEELYLKVCRVAVEEGYFRLVWVGLVDRDSQSIKPVAHWGFEEGFLQKIRISLQEDPEGLDLTGAALREGRYAIWNDLEHDPRMAPWRNEALKRGYRSSAAFPLRVDAELKGAIYFYSLEPNFFTVEEIILLKRLAENLSFAIESAEYERERRRAEEALREREREARRLAEENSVMAEIGRIISSTPDIEHVYEEFVEEVRKVIPLDRVVISAIDPEAGILHNVYVAGK